MTSSAIFYLRMTRRMGWTKDVLVHQIVEPDLRKNVAEPDEFRANIARADPRTGTAGRERLEYTFDFLELADELQCSASLSKRSFHESSRTLREYDAADLPLLVASTGSKLATRNTLLICCFTTGG